MSSAITTFTFKFYNPSKRTFKSHKNKHPTPIKTPDTSVNITHHDEIGMSKGNELDATFWPPLSSFNPSPATPTWPTTST